MADEKEQKEQKEQTESPQPQRETSNDAHSGGMWYVWVILCVVTLSGATGGLALSRLIGGTDMACPAAANSAKQQETENLNNYIVNSESGKNPWSYENIEPIVANLDEPGVTRYVRVSVTLEMSPDIEKNSGLAFMDDKKLVLRDWLTTYFAGLSLEDVRGTRNLERIKRQIQDQFNDILFPNSKPMVQRVLFKEFAVQ